MSNLLLHLAPAALLVLPAVAAGESLTAASPG
jgi:hypothetical protein